jgi:hypothetical protein
MRMEEKKYILGGKEYRQIEKFFSRVNSVFLIESAQKPGQLFVLKDFEKNLKRLHSELKGADIFNNVSPEILYSDDRYIIHEYIPGKTLLSVYEECEREDSGFETIVSSLINFFLKVHSSDPGYILSDVNLTNFIADERSFSDSGEFGLRYVDYESVKKGEKEEDIGRFAAFALTYDPVLTEWKYRFASEFIRLASDYLNADKNKITEYLKKEIHAMNKRRPSLINAELIFKIFGG